MIKIVTFMGGVGNQLFQYNLYRYFQSRGHRVYYMDNTGAFDVNHHGLEVNKYFDVDVRPVPRWLYRLLRPVARFTLSTDEAFKPSDIFFGGYWQDKKYVGMPLPVKFKSLPLSEANRRALELIEQGDSVSIHVRRGDYLKPNNVKIFGGICTEAYYQEAIRLIGSRIKTPRFFIFSDDIAWCKAHLPVGEATYIDWNTDDDSIYDMYLMARCKANILANSTFSYWAAVNSGNRLVVYPRRWFADRPAPNLFPNDWTGL